MSIEYQGIEFSRREAVFVVLSENNINLDPPASVYADRIANGSPIAEPLNIETQIRYLISSIYVVDEDTRRAKRQLEAIVEGESLNSVEQKDVEAGYITEKEHEDIMFGFEAFMERKVQRGELLTMEDFEEYAEETGYSLQKVLYANGWCDSVIDAEALARIKEAEESITMASDSQ